VTLDFDFLTVDCRDPQALAEFWASALGDYAILEDDEDDTSEGTDEDEDSEVVVLPASRRGPKLLFIKVPEEKEIKNRLHFDLRPSDSDKDAEVARLEALAQPK
jgi:Glyoxalase-like domain